MKSLWNNESAAEATGGEARGLWAASRVEIDSRRVQLGDLFVAIKGERVDGHHYVADALARGAVAAVVSQVPEGMPRGASLLVVEDTLEALAGMARFARAKSAARIVGITGSVGKTTAKEMLKLALAVHGKTHASSGNFNNHIGLPLNLANLPPDAAFGIFEMGMNHAGEIDHLTKMVRPHVAVITNIEAVHLEFFNNIDAIADAKAEIFAGLEPEGIAVLPADSPHYGQLRAKAGGARVLAFGEKPGADARLAAYSARDGGAEVMAEIAGQTISFSLAATGRHMALAATSALAVAQALALPLPKTAAALLDFTEVEGRGKLLPLALAGGKAWLVDDSYNASPASMKAAIARADEIWAQKGRKGRKIAVLGDMLELGADAPQLHAGLSDALIAHGFHQIYTAGGLMQHLNAALPGEMRGRHMLAAAQLLPLLQKTLAPGDIVLVKGSHGSKMHELAAAVAKLSY